MENTPAFLRFIYEKVFRYMNHINLVVIGLCLLAALYARYALTLNHTPEIGGVESNVIYSVLRMLGGHPLYENPELPPFSITQYTPLYYYIVFYVCKLFGVASGDAYGVYVASRAISLIFNIAYMALVYAIIVRFFRSSKIMAFAAAAFSFIFLGSSIFSRPDSLFLVLFFLIVWHAFVFVEVYEQGLRKKAYTNLTFITLYTILLFLTKQSAIYVPFLLWGYLLLFVKDKRYLIFSLFTTLVTVPAILYFTNWLHGGQMFVNIIDGVKNGIDLTWFFENVFEVYLLRDIIWNVAGIALGIVFLFAPRSRKEPLMGILLLGSFAFALLTSLKYGSGPSYFKDFNGLVFISVAYILDKVMRYPWLEKAEWGIVYFFIIMFTLLPNTGRLFMWKTQLFDNVQVYNEQLEIRSDLIEKHGLRDGDFVLTTTHMDDFLNKLLADNCLFPQKEIVLGAAYPLGVFNYAAFDKLILDGKVSFLITKNFENIDELEFMQHKFTDYTLIAEYSYHKIYKFTKH